MERAAHALADAFDCEVMIRFNSDRASGGAWLVTEEQDAVGRNAEVGIIYASDPLSGEPPAPRLLVSAVAAQDERSHYEAASDLEDALGRVRALCWATSGADLAGRVVHERQSGIHRLVLRCPDDREAAVVLTRVSPAHQETSRYQVVVDGEPVGLMIAQGGEWVSAVRANGHVVAKCPATRTQMLEALLGW